jgi:hypothetical protein
MTVARRTNVALTNELDPILSNIKKREIRRTGWEE